MDFTNAGFFSMCIVAVETNEARSSQKAQRDRERGLMGARVCRLAILLSTPEEIRSVPLVLHSFSHSFLVADFEFLVSFLSIRTV